MPLFKKKEDFAAAIYRKELAKEREKQARAMAIKKARARARAEARGETGLRGFVKIAGEAADNYNRSQRKKKRRGRSVTGFDLGL